MITSPPDTGHMIPYFLLGTTKYALVSVVSSLATNVLATSLIAYQAWCVPFIFSTVPTTLNIDRLNFIGNTDDY